MIFSDESPRKYTIPGDATCLFSLSFNNTETFCEKNTSYNDGANRLIQFIISGRLWHKNTWPIKDFFWTSRCFSRGIQSHILRWLGCSITSATYSIRVPLPFSGGDPGSLGSVASKWCNFNNESYGIWAKHQVRCKRDVRARAIQVV